MRVSPCRALLPPVTLLVTVRQRHLPHPPPPPPRRQEEQISLENKRRCSTPWRVNMRRPDWQLIHTGDWDWALGRLRLASRAARLATHTHRGLGLGFGTFAPR
uniref:Uncharacterized protein n=1 Tax=Cacopsylla melanoneura TaxID=428564 RepID=A0A8D8ZWG1_9HEMI